MAVPLAGTISFLFTDIEESTRLLQHLGDTAAADLFDDHRKILRASVARYGGEERDTQGDSFLFAFQSAREAMLAAIDGQRSLSVHPWPEGVALRVRMGIHTTEPVHRKGALMGLGVHRAARICAAGRGDQILLSQTTADILANDLPPGVALRDRGEHWLKDLQRPERIFQVLLPDLPPNLSPLRSLSILPTNLPTQLSSFVGRQGETTRIKDLMAVSRLVTLIGPAGTGKTRLALHVAADLTDVFPDGVWLVELAPLSDPAMVPPAVAAVLGVREQPGTALVDALTESVGRRRLLLVLDNCEHLVAACRHMAETVLGRCPHLRLLSTSREGLALTGESLFPVPPLSLPDVRRFSPDGVIELDHLMEYEAIRLFTTRSQAASPGFALTPENAGAILEICYRLDGLPLAIELVAARTRHLSPDQIVQRLQDRFSLLVNPRMLGRHQSLRAAIDWSYDLLAPGERGLFNRLSAFAGSFSLQAVEAICSGGEVNSGRVLDLLGSLIDKTLVVTEEGRFGVRYRLLESLREYGTERLTAEGEREVFRRRHRDFFLHLAEEGEHHRHAPDLGEWLRRLEDDHDNLRAALAWSLETSQEAEGGLRLAVALRYFWMLRGHGTEAHAWFEKALGADEGRPSIVRARVLNALAGVLGNLEGWGGGTRVESLYEESLRLFRGFEDKEGIGMVTTNFGSLAMVEGDFAKARRLFEEALALYQASGDRNGVAFLLFKLGNMARRQGDLIGALTSYEESIALYRDLGDRSGTARTLNAMGVTHRLQMDLTRARELLEESLALSEEMEEMYDRPMTHLNLGYVEQYEQRYGDAARHFAIALEECRQTGDRPGMVAAGAALGGNAALQEEFERSAVVFAATENLRKHLGPEWISPAEDRIANAQNLARTRAALGEERFDELWKIGLHLPLEEAISCTVPSRSRS